MAWLLRPPSRAYLVLLASALRAFRGSQRRKEILAANHVLYENQGVVWELEDFLIKAASEKRPG